MKVYRFTDEDLRTLASLAIDLETDHLCFKIVRVIQPKDNYWSFDMRFSHDANKLDTYYDSFQVDCGRDNKPETYQMRVTTKKNDDFKIKPITNPLVVVHFFEEMCGRASISLQ
jgi:hypothetical protein